MGILSFFKKARDDEPKFKDNMNYMVFEGEGVFIKTGRTRKFHVEAFSEKEARSELCSSGYDEDSIIISRVPFEPPTDAQIQAMRKHGNMIPKNACKYDLSFLMTKIIEKQHDPGKSLMNFATEHKVKFSYYSGEESLYLCIWNSFEDIDKAAFYLLCVKKDRTGKWEFDSWDVYRDKAENALSDTKFYNSFKRYLKSGFFGFTDNASSRDTNCYKIASAII